MPTVRKLHSQWFEIARYAAQRITLLWLFAKYAAWVTTTLKGQVRTCSSRYYSQKLQETRAALNQMAKFSLAEQGNL